MVSAGLWETFLPAFLQRKSDRFISSLVHDGCQLTTCRDYIARLDGSTQIDGGWLNRNYIQLVYQLADSVAGIAYSFGGSCIILFLINLIPGLGLRSKEEDEIVGIDDAELGEFAVR